MHNEARDASYARRWATTITVRNLPPAVAKAVRDRARRENLSLNRAVIRLLEEATVEKRSTEAAHHDLDHLAGRWSEEEYQQFMAVLAEHRQVDPGMWR